MKSFLFHLCTIWKHVNELYEFIDSRNSSAKNALQRLLTEKLMEYLKDALTFNKILCGDLILLIVSSNQRMREQMFGDRSEYDPCCEELELRRKLYSS